MVPRQARIRGNFSIYHIIQRGNEKKPIFLSDEDKKMFIHTLFRMKNKYDFHIYSYCIMDNHVHLLIYDNGKNISQIIKSINISYAMYFNRKYKRVGHLFQDRFKSELVADDTYLIEVSKYIHNNPVKAGIVREPEQYLWSSYNIYIGKKQDIQGLVEPSKILCYFSENKQKAINMYNKYVKRHDEEKLKIMDIEANIEDDQWVDEEHIGSMQQALDKLTELGLKENLTLNQIINDKQIRNRMIRIIRKESTLTLKEIGEVFGGLSESSVSKILK